MKMQCYAVLLLWLSLFGTGCSLLEVPEPSGVFNANGPYWDGPLQNFTAGHVLNYLQQLRTLSDNEIDDESHRIEKAHADFKRPVDQIQYLLILVTLPTSPDNNKTMGRLVSELDQNTAFLRTDVHELLFLVKAIVFSKLASHLRSPSSDMKVQVVKNDTSELKKKLKTCNEQSKTLAGQIQKLKDIERILNERELSTGK